MGQKVHPNGFRLGYIYDWKSKWYADKNYTELLHEDLGIRKKIQEMLPDAGIAKVEIALARGKKIHDKRQTEKQRDWQREKARLLRERG